METDLPEHFAVLLGVHVVVPKGAISLGSLGSGVDHDDHDTPSGTSAAYALLAQLGKTDARYAEAATKILARMTNKIQSAPAASGQLRHHLFRGEAAGEGFLDDYAMLGLAYLALGEATGEPVWVSRAQALASAILTRFINPDGLVVISVADASLVPPCL